MNLFSKYQKQLLKLANNPFGRRFLEIPDKERIIKLTDNSYHFLQGDKVRSIVRGYPLYAKKLSAALSSLEILNTVPSYVNMDKYGGLLNYAGLLKDREFPQVLLATKNIYASAGDGYTNYAQNDTTFANARNDNGTNCTATSTTLSLDHARVDANNYHSLSRVFIPFDTSSLGFMSRVTAASLKIYGTSVSDTTGTLDIVVTQSTQASLTTLAAADNDNITLNTPPEGTDARFDIGTWSTTGYNTFTLNATGIGWIGVTTNAKFCLRFSSDVDNQDVPNPDNNSCIGKASEEAGTSTDPHLSITYTPVFMTVLLET